MEMARLVNIAQKVVRSHVRRAMLAIIWKGHPVWRFSATFQKDANLVSIKLTGDLTAIVQRANMVTTLLEAHANQLAPAITEHPGAFAQQLVWRVGRVMMGTIWMAHL